jgi:hypothetical protein
MVEAVGFEQWIGGDVEPQSVRAAAPSSIILPLALTAALLVGSVVHGTENSLPFVIIRAVGMVQYATEFTPPNTISGAVNKTGGDHHEITRVGGPLVRLLLGKVLSNAPVCPGEYCPSVWRGVKTSATIAKHFFYLALHKILIKPLGSLNYVHFNGSAQIVSWFFSRIFEPQSNCGIFIFMLPEIVRGNDLLWSDPSSPLQSQSLISFVQNVPLLEANHDQTKSKKAQKPLNDSIRIDKRLSKSLKNGLFWIGILLGLVASICVVVRCWWWLPAYGVGLVFIAMGCLVVIAVVFAINVEANTQGPSRGQLTLISDFEAKFDDVFDVAGKRIVIPGPSRQELVSLIVHCSNDVLRTYIDISACNFAIWSKHKWLFDSSLRLIKNKISFVKLERGSYSASHIGCRSGAGISPEYPHPDPEKNPVGIDQSRGFWLSNKYVSPLYYAGVLRLLFADTGEGDCEPRNYASGDSGDQYTPRINGFEESPNRIEEYVVTDAVIGGFAFAAYLVGKGEVR